MFKLGPSLLGWNSVARLRRRIERATRRRLEGPRTGWFPPAALAASIGLFAGGVTTVAWLELFPVEVVAIAESPAPAGSMRSRPRPGPKQCHDFALIFGGEDRMIRVDDQGIPCD